MKHTLFAAASLLALTIATGASAADLPRKTVAPIMTVPAFTWTGFYVGLNAGYGWGDFKRTAFANRISFPGSGPSIDQFATRTLSADGFVGGAQIGYNYQMGNIVLGLEGDFNYSGLKKSVGPDQILGVPAGNFLTSSSKLEWFGTVRPRVGVAFDRFLVYATGGLAFGSVKVSDAFAFGAGPETGSSSSTRTGYAIGGGLEYAFTNNLTVKAEYLYVDLGKANYAAPGIAGFANSDIQMSNKTTLNIARVGVNYKF